MSADERPAPQGEHAEIDGEELRSIMTRLVSGVSVITCRRGSVDLAMTATSLVSVSLEPPRVLFTVHEQARMADVVAPPGHGRWAVSILDGHGLRHAEWLADPGRPAIGQLGPVPHRLGEVSGAAILEDAAAWLECETEWVKPAGTHLVVVGRVLDGGVRPGAAGAVLHAFGRLEPYPPR